VAVLVPEFCVSAPQGDVSENGVRSSNGFFGVITVSLVHRFLMPTQSLSAVCS